MRNFYRGNNKKFQYGLLYWAFHAGNIKMRYFIKLLYKAKMFPLNLVFFQIRKLLISLRIGAHYLVFKSACILRRNIYPVP